MNDDDLKKIADVVDERVNKALDPIKVDLKELKEDVDTLKGSVLTIEQTIKSYADSYKINQKNIERLDTRLVTVEDHLDIASPEDLKVPHFAK